MKTVIVGLLATVLLGAAVIAPDATGEVPSDSSSIAPESVSVSGSSLPESPDVSDSEVADESVPESEPAPGPGEDSAESEAEPESGDMEEAASDESELEADLEAESAEEPEGVLLSDVFAVHLAGGQADSIMGFHGMQRSADCARVAAVIALSDYMAPTEDEAYFRVWEALNATLTAQAESGAAAANCVFADGTITVWI